MKFVLVFFFVAVGFSVSTAFITPEQATSLNALVPVQRQQSDLYASSRRLIEQLIEALRKAARDAYDAIARITTNIQEEVKTVRDKIINDIQRLTDRVSSALQVVRARLSDSGVAVVDCISSHRSDANAIFNETLTKAMTCVDERIAEIADQISSVRTLANKAIEFGDKAMDDMKKCTDDEASLLATGSCLAAVSMQTEIRALVYATQSALSMGRVNLSIATLPAALEVCAGSRLVDAGMTTVRLLMEIGTCSATNAFNAMNGDVDMNTNW